MQTAAIIGCGRIAEQGHAPAYLKLQERVKVTALADPSADRLAVLGDVLRVPPQQQYTDHRALLERAEVDFVDIATPHFLHEPLVQDCAAAGRNILLEKPLATTLEEAERMLEAVRKAAVVFGVIHNYKYNPPYAAALRVIKEGGIGKPFLFRSEGLGRSHYPGTSAYDPDWRTRAAAAGGGVLIDNAYHNLYLAREFMQSAVTEVYAAVGTFTRPIEVDDTAIVLLRHASGAVSSVQVAWSVPSSRRVDEIHGDRATIRFDLPERPITLIPADATGAEHYQEPELPAGPSGFAGLIDDYLAALEQGTPPPVTGDEAYANLRVVMAAYESSRTRRAISLA